MNATLVIYLNSEKTAIQKITPSDQFDGYSKKGEIINSRWRLLAEGLTVSDLERGIKNFHSYEIIRHDQHN